MISSVRAKALLWLAVIACASLACGSGAASKTDGASNSDGMVDEKICGESSETYIYATRVEDLAKYADCTVLMGRIQVDSARELMDFAPLGNVRRIEGALNLFRSPGFVTLQGLENLEEVRGDLSVHLNDNLTSIAGLAKLRTVTGTLLIARNGKVPQAEADLLGTRVTVGGEKILGPQATQ